jgi:myo-inositol-1(or 4)-monophosphatase
METEHPFPWLKKKVRSVGSYQRDSRGRTNRAETDQKGRVDLVTEIDQESERRLVDAIRDRHREDGILAEENIQENTDNNREWIIDPLDGTTNYVQSHPFYGISVALREDDRMIHATVYFPELDDFYRASRGQGAYKNGHPISVSSTREPMESFLATGFADLRSKDADLRYNLEVFPDLLEKVQGIRRGGSAVHDLSLLAEGVFDGFWEFNLAPWDVAAGSLLIEEAGGTVTDMRGENDWLHGRNIVASNGVLHQTLLSWIQDHLPDAFPQRLQP